LNNLFSNKIRCDWCGNDPLYMKYHDEEWGVPVHEDRKHFEFLVLESAQAGLSWITILRKRENYRKAYDDFDFIKVAQYDEVKVNELIQDQGIVRNKLKISASINNARMFLEIQEEFGSFDNYIWAFVDNNPLINHWETLSQVPATSELSDKVSKDLKKRGFKFLGSTIIYAHLQATGIINDHITSCFRYKD
jgi:DNA-3-methyladenine glycosylase I